MDPPRRSSSSLSFPAVRDTLDGMVAKLMKRFEPYVRGVEVGAEFLARIARGEAFDATTDAYRKGLEHGVRNERERLGLPVDSDNPDGPTRPVICPHCGR